MEQIDKLYNNDAECEILGIMIKDNTKIPSIRVLINSKDFFAKHHQAIFNAIIKMVDKEKPVDIVTLSEQLSFDGHLEQIGGRGYINDLYENVITTSNYKNYCNIIINYSKKRKVIELCESSISSMRYGLDIEEVIGGLRVGLEDILINKSSDNLTHISSGIEEVVDQVETILKSDNKILGLPTPFTNLNKFLSGLVKGRLYILGARPSQGKSALAMQIADTISVNYNVAFASLEMSTTEYTQRKMFSMCNINQDMIADNKIGNEVYDKLYSCVEPISKLKLYIIDNIDCKLSDIENGIINCIDKQGSCDLVVVDYLQLMASPDKKKKDDYDIVTANSKGLKRLARKYNVPVLALCQLSRALEIRQDKRPQLSDLRDSGSIEQDADVVMMLYRDEYYDPRPDNRGKAELLIRKNRQGRTGMIPLVFEANRTRFKEVYNAY